jgi:hypothetical protein
MVETSPPPLYLWVFPQCNIFVLWRLKMWIHEIYEEVYFPPERLRFEYIPYSLYSCMRNQLPPTR